VKRVALALFILGFGLLPIWVASAIVYYGSLGASATSGYWNVAPWLIVLAIPVCAVTLAIAGVTIAVHRRTEGEPSRKWRFSTLTFAMLVVAVGAAGGAWWNYRRELQNEWQHAVEFVRTDRTIAELVGREPRAELTWTRRRNGTPAFYGVAASGTRTVYAVVAVSRSWVRTPEFAIACISREDIRSEDRSADDPCAPR
jgi:hypothetical protein